jgi:hypothetical protein
MHHAWFGDLGTDNNEEQTVVIPPHKFDVYGVILDNAKGNVGILFNLTFNPNEQGCRAVAHRRHSGFRPRYFCQAEEASQTTAP